MRDRKRRMEIYSFYDHTGLERHLAHMAAKGWLLEKTNNFFWTYRRVEPMTCTFSVTYFAKASEFDPYLSEQQQTFVDFCEASGWRLAATTAQMQIFYTTAPDPVPIETDPVIQVETIHRAMKRNYLPSHAILLVLGLLQLGIALWGLSDNPIRTFASPFTLASLVPWLLVVLLALVEIISYFRWYKRAAKAAREEGVFSPTRSTRAFQLAVLCIVTIYLLGWFASLAADGSMALTIGLMSLAYMAALLAAVNGLKHFLKKRQVSKNVNRAVTFGACFVLSFAMIFLLAFCVMRMDRAGVFDDEAAEQYEYKGTTFTKYNDTLPLTVEDLNGEEYSEDTYSRWLTRESSVFLTEVSASQSPTLNHLGAPDLDYTLVEVHFSPLYSLCKEHLLTQYADWGQGDVYQPVDPEPWQAAEVYQRYWWDESFHDYLVFWEDAMLDISFDWPPTDAQKAMVAEKLHPQ